jgi:type I restriction enzyme S subunit
VAGKWPVLSLRDAGVELIDCDHRTPPAAENGSPYVAIPQLRAGRIDFSDARRISSEHFAQWTRKANPASHDVVLSRRCNPGETAFVAPGSEFALGQNLVLLRADGAKVFPPFLRWLVRGPEWWEQIAKFLNVGAIFDSLKCADVPNFTLRIPPLPEQRAIAHILGTLDDKIELSRRMGETLEAMARALFKSWFVDFDPVRAKAEGRDPCLPHDIAASFPSRFVDSEHGEIPEGWGAGTVNDLCRAIFSGGTPSTQRAVYWGGDIPWLSSGETREKFIVGTEKRITQAGVAQSSTRLAPAFATVIASAGQGNTRGQTSLLTFESYINQSVVALTANPRRSSDYHLFFDLERRYEEFRRISDAHSSRGSLTTKLLASLPAILPTSQAIESFENFVGPYVSRIVGLRRESRTLAALRDALLPKLMSGELRVRDAERFLERDAVGSAAV